MEDLVELRSASIVTADESMLCSMLDDFRFVSTRQWERKKKGMQRPT